MLPAARMGDLHTCPIHGPSNVLMPCCVRVQIENKPAARKGDAALCPSGPDPILDGSPTVLIGNRPAARAAPHPALPTTAPRSSTRKVAST